MLLNSLDQGKIGVALSMHVYVYSLFETFLMRVLFIFFLLVINKNCNRKQKQKNMILRKLDEHLILVEKLS